MPLFIVSDPEDPRVDDYRNIPDPELIRRRGVFVAEGRLVVRRLLVESPLVTRSLMLTASAHETLADVFAEMDELPVYLVSQPIMDAVTGFNIHRGCLAIGERPALRPWDEVIEAPGPIVVLERVTNADNIGGIFRAAAAFGAGGVLLDRGTLDPLYRKAIRTSMGASLVLPFARVESCPAALSALRDRDIATIALTPRAGVPPLREICHAVAPRRAALVLGHEGEGLSASAMGACHYLARIPISSAVDSLNVATAAAVALYELTMYRDIGPSGYRDM